MDIKETHKQEYDDLVIRLYETNEMRDRLIKRINELELILSTIKAIDDQRETE